MTENRISSVDGLRAIAMMMVMAEHCGLMPVGWVGVWLFYVISGFVITRNFLAERETGIAKLPHYASFLVRRFFRIIPPYFGYIAIASGAVLLVGKPGQFHDLPYLATMTENWWLTFHHAHTAPFTFVHLWTISVEEQFYLVFPLLFFLVPARRFPLVLAILIMWEPLIRWALVQFLIRHGVTAYDELSYGVHFSSVGQFDAFLMGALLAHFEGSIRKSQDIARYFAIVSITAFGLYFVAYVFINRHYLHAQGDKEYLRLFTGTLFGQGREMFVYSVLDLCAATLVVLAIREWRPLRFLSLKLFAWMGLNSYSGYLYHPLALMLFLELGLRTGSEDMTAFSLWIRLAAFAFVLPASLAAAIVSNALIERRARAFSHSLAATLTTKTRRRPTTSMASSDSRREA